jgi:hypothetical protein
MAKFGFGSKVDGAFFCRGVEVGFGHCCKGVAHHGGSSFQDEDIAGGAVCSRPSGGEVSRGRL